MKAERAHPLTSESPLKATDSPSFTAVSISEVVNTGLRLDAQIYSNARKTAYRELESSNFTLHSLGGENGLAVIYNRPRFKRIFLEKSDYPIYQPSQITDIYPKPQAFISSLTNTDIDSLRVKQGQILVTCSGTIGSCSFVSDTLDNLIFSHDVMRIQPKEFAGFIYAYLRTSIGQTLLKTNDYGAVVKHIEPEHMYDLPVPDMPCELKGDVDRLIKQSYQLRDESNRLIDNSQQLLGYTLQIGDIRELLQTSNLLDSTRDILNFSIPISRLNTRLDASFHNPIVNSIESHLREHAKEVVRADDSRLVADVVLPGRFKRVYVDSVNGIPFFGGKQILSLEPNNMKFLSPVHHRERIERELLVRENMILITCSGTIGKVAITPKHWDGWTANQHIARLVPISPRIAGFLYAWLSSDIAYPLLARFTYGAVVDEIDSSHVRRLPIPLLKDASVQETINDMILHANEKRFSAYEIEKRAIATVEEHLNLHTN
ncbi:MAG: restriction endonuclease subunit S [Gammaproteobacteria bacterium]|nr:restriction endonuclease subunit S [Gammaproteobacteria bacterium]